MNRSERAIRVGLASFAALLMVAMLALGGLVVTGSGGGSGLSAILTSAPITAPRTAANDTAVAQSTTTTQQTAATLQQQSGAVDARNAVRVAGPAVVTVINTLQQSTTGRGRTFPGQGLTQEASGSGVIIDSQGYIVTNQHVVANQQTLAVIFADGTQVPATLVGEDAYSDIAVLKVDASKVPAVAKFGDSSALEPGQPVVAIGTALGNYSNTVTEGIVSALHRQLGDGSTSTQDLIQTDAAINHGNSGGPLLDLNGNVVGINTAVVRDSGMTGDVAEGLGFAIPSNTARNVAQQLIQKGSISHPYLGITYQLITPQLATDNNLSRQQGAFVSEVATGSPAEKAGIQANSILTKLDGVTITSNSGSTLVDLLNKHQVGDSVKLTVVAPGTNSEKEVTVVLAQRPTGQ